MHVELYGGGGIAVACVYFERLWREGEISPKIQDAYLKLWH